MSEKRNSSRLTTPNVDIVVAEDGQKIYITAAAGLGLSLEIRDFGSQYVEFAMTGYIMNPFNLEHYDGEVRYYSAKRVDGIVFPSENENPVTTTNND